MRGFSPPLRFLTLVLGGWIGLRGTILASGWWEERPEETAPVRVAAPPMAASDEPETSPQPMAAAPVQKWAIMSPCLGPNPALPAPQYVSALVAPSRGATAEVAPVAVYETNAAPLMPVALIPPSLGSRWSASLWLFYRREGSASFVPGGMLGGSQVGGRIAYRLAGGRTSPLAASARLYAPLENWSAAEAAAGLDWKPLAALPVHLLAERRQKLGHDGRSAFSATAYGGLSDEKAGPLRIDAYGQAGIVGLRSRDLFIDGAVKLGLPVGRAKVGAGLWGAAQPGVSRLDVGPQASFRLPIGSAVVVVAADWRLRVAGDASPRSAPTLTLSTEF